MPIEPPCPSVPGTLECQRKRQNIAPALPVQAQATFFKGQLSARCFGINSPKKRQVAWGREGWSGGLKGEKGESS